jgi:HlyD family secretion protein
MLLSLAATDSLLETTRGLTNATETAEGARRDLDALKAERDAYEQNWLVEVSQKLADQTQKLADAREQLNKARLRRQLVELRANLDATVLTVAKVSIGSVLQSGDQFITLVPTDAPLEVEANILGRDGGFVQLGASVAVKFDTFPFSQYGLAHGTVRTISADSFTGQDDGKTRSGSVPAKPEGIEPFYRSRITIDDVQLHNVPAGFRIVPGMPVTADIMIGKRTVLTYLLGRILPVASEAMREP